MSVATVHMTELCELTLRYCRPMAALVMPSVVASMVGGAAFIATSGLSRLHGRMIERQAAVRAVVVVVAATLGIGAAHESALILGLPESPIRLVAWTAIGIVAVGVLVGLLTAGWRGGSALEDGRAPHGEPAVEFGLHAQFPRERG